jgi:hypothetical protein
MILTTTAGPILMVLFAHDDESIRLFTNMGNGSFAVTRILTFPPVYGSSGFQLVDFDKDGLLDILYTCRDNADLSSILKPFHGVYIYRNKGDWNFEQAYFYPVNGCTKAIAADFDNDGDMDLASIAFFADFKNKPEEKFLYFEQDGPFHFCPMHRQLKRKEGGSAWMPRTMTRTAIWTLYWAILPRAFLQPITPKWIEM